MTSCPLPKEKCFHARYERVQIRYLMERKLDWIVAGILCELLIRGARNVET